MDNYKVRIANETLADKLDAMDAVLIKGPKYCGKTTLACQHAKNVLYMADPDTRILTGVGQYAYRRPTTECWGFPSEVL